MRTVAEAAVEPAPARRYRGLSPAERAAQRRRKLLDAGTELFASKGYGSVSINELCRASGVTERHFYELFPSRSDLLEAIYLEIAEQARESVLAAVRSVDPTDLVAVARAGIAAYCTFIVEDRRRGALITTEAMALPSQMTFGVVGMFTELLETFLEPLTDQIDVPSLHLAVVFVVGGMSQVQFDWIKRGGADLSEVIDTLVELFLRVGRITPGDA